ncbi:Germin-like protein [Thalictrum thalictroides]|uniref:Germin-like protein n=1 Tax=Thalictrum thalictroides TaxID=46969 RepID=A0A7J6UX50_THATH|nr:Germin-like protein [Thalictrum thalictroides]
MDTTHQLIVLILFAVTSFVLAADPSPLQDFCVAIDEPHDACITSNLYYSDSMFVNGKFCKNPVLVVAEDFTLGGLNIPGNTSNQLGVFVTPATVAQLPGLNTLGISLVRIDYAPYGGLNPPHTHPRATEALVVLEGTLYVGFVTSNPENRLISKVLYEGDVFVFPQGLIHFQFNIGKTKAVAFAGLGSQNPGVITIANAVFGSNPPISDDVLAKAFQIDKKLVDYLQAQFWTKTN